MTTATAPAPAISRQVLEDRYDGLLARTSAGKPLDPSKLQTRLDRVLQALVSGVARVEWTGDLDGEGRDGTGAITDELEAVIRQTLLDSIESRGLAR